MSLYILGRIKLAQQSTQIEQKAFVRSQMQSSHLYFDIDKGDCEVIDELNKASTGGLFFRIADDLESSDATELWDELYTAIKSGSDLAEDKKEIVLNSRLGSCVNEVLSLSKIEAGCISFFDGAIDNAWEMNRRAIWLTFTQLVEKPWDTIPNPLFCWSG